MTEYGLTTFIDLSRNEELFSTVENADLPNPFPNIEERTHIHKRQILRTSANLVQLFRHGVSEIMTELDITGRDCEGIVISSCNPANQKSLDTLACFIACENGIDQHAGVNYACSGFPASVEKAMDNQGNDAVETNVSESNDTTSSEETTATTVEAEGQESSDDNIGNA